LSSVVESQYFILSEEVSSLEREIAQYTNVSYAAGVASGTDALILSLKAAGIGQGDRVITTAFTFFATSEAVSILGGVPVFVDINPDTFNIDPDKIEKFMENASSEVADSVKAILPVHLYGQCADMTRIQKIAEKYDLKIIEDCCQAIGSYHKGKKAGAFGLSGCYSFFPSKNLGGFGDGGMIVSSNNDLINRIKKLRVHGSTEQYIHDEIGHNSRLDSLQAAVLRVKLKKLDMWLEGRRRIAQKYDSAFSGCNIATPEVAEGNVHTYHQYTIKVDERNELLKYLNDKGIGARIYYPVPLHLQPCYRDLGYSIGSLPVSETVAEKVLSLPVYPELSDEKVDYVIDTVLGFYKKN
jgi:dTDP-4-amino-4,6-dideoxygalactose transaminase